MVRGGSWLGLRKGGKERESQGAGMVDKLLHRQANANNKQPKADSGPGGGVVEPAGSARLGSHEQLSFRKQLHQQEILNSYYGIRGASRSKSRSHLRADRESSGAHSNTFSRLKSNYTRKQSPLISITRYAAAPDVHVEDGAGRSAKSICISNVNDANNFRKKVQQAKQVNRSI